MNIYQNRSRFKIGIVLLAALIGSVSVLYTNRLAKQLSEREKKLIDLYAKAFESINNSNLTDDVTFLTHEIIAANNTIPVILTDAEGNISATANIDIPKFKNDAKRKEWFDNEIALMKGQHEPIIITYEGTVTNYIYYENSMLLRQLRYYPYIQLSVIGILGLIAYLAFSYSRRAEQNRVWVGLAKETAHQLGTPISALMAWVEYLRTDPRFDGENDEILNELDKDIKRLETVTARFSNIGSVPAFQEAVVYDLINQNVEYLRKRVSSKVSINLVAEGRVQESTSMISPPLLDWVVENICKNAVDAMNGTGRIDIVLTRIPDDKIAIDISDTGKGLPKNMLKKVFEPGVTSKKRGWGLGLTLAKRIIEEYHKGKIFIKHSEIGKGTTFRIILKE
ncbi:Histidine kinase-, DNA gyrase B-, and HSP90-like ATPase [Flexibacter flexilis DSM 6793]|uniref:histidine kinase n=1 Tax=Flexibacter flexilis DSM 6793 TaxID=927664 RepID=A0A1I1LBG2_9BACT|nr:ATP-binding protein [Flexibacter flexilis]SFC70285.1 Histidine kinase-, DNA gyrase B-, and HSP90-like ATPase [Flexibacter flexilis DSM 6793]